MNEYWLNRISIGKGTLKAFQEEYDMISAGDNQFCTASQVFPIMDKGTSTGVYEYVIYYKVNPAVLKVKSKALF